MEIEIASNQWSDELFEAAATPVNEEPKAPATPHRRGATASPYQAEED